MTPRRWCASVAALLLVAGSSACGISGEAEPELLAVEDVPDGLLEAEMPTSTTTPHELDTAQVDVFFVKVDGDAVKLRAVRRDVTDEGSVEERLIALLEQPPDEQEADDGLQTAIPNDTVLAGPVRIREGGLVVVNLSREFLENEGQAQRTAFAQVVMTATDTAGITRVRFQIEDEDHAAIIGDGTTRDRSVTRADYEPLGSPTPTRAQRTATGGGGQPKKTLATS